MNKTPLFDILVQSWNLSFSKTILLFFGFLMALPIASQFLVMPEGVPDIETLTRIITASPDSALLFFSFYVLATIVGKGSLIRSLSQAHHALSRNDAPPTHSYCNTLRKIFLLELAFVVFLVGVTLILITPSTISLWLFQRVPETLLVLGLIVFVPIIIVTLFVRQFSYYYFLLSPLRLKSAIERGTWLLLRHRLPSFLFGLLYLFIYSIFTFSLNLAMLGGVVLFVKFFGGTAEPIFSFFCSLFFLTWYAVFGQALWFSFFLHLAKPKNPLPSENPLLKEDGLPETPSI